MSSRRVACRWMTGLVAAAMAASPARAQDGIVIVDRDDVVVTTDAIVQFGSNPIVDDEGDGVLRIEGDGLVIRLIGTLDGIGLTGSPEDRGGIGVVVRGRGISIGGGTIRGFAVGLDAAGSDDLAVVGTRFEDGRTQRLASAQDAERGTDWLPVGDAGIDGADGDGADDPRMPHTATAVRVRDARRVSLREITVRRWQNGLQLENVDDSVIADCDASFLSGWGLSLRGASRNLVASNAFDFCVRGYSHGAYALGQGSAGVRIIGGSRDNEVLFNSITHGGSGIAVIGDAAVDGRPSGTVIARNDISYAATDGIRLALSSGDRISGNRIIGNAAHGLRALAVVGPTIDHNEFAVNGDALDEMARPAVRLDGVTGSTVMANRFRGRRPALHLAATGPRPVDRNDPDPAVMIPAATSGDHVVGHNRYTEPADDAADAPDAERSPLSWDDAGRVWTDQMATDRSTPARLPDLAPLADGPPARTAAPDAFDADARLAERSLRPAADPRGAREALTGRAAIVMDAYGPWDHEEPLLRRIRQRPLFDEWEVHLPGSGLLNPVDLPEDAIRTQGEVRHRRRPGVIIVLPEVQPVASPYRLQVVAGGTRMTARSTVVRSQWNSMVFPWQNDPVSDYGGWFNDSEQMSIQLTNFATDHQFRFGGPSDVRMGITVRRAGLPADAFGVLANTEIEFPPGRWRIIARSDDGIRVRVNEELVIDDWADGPPRTRVWEFDADIAVSQSIDFEYFERSGYGMLELRVEPADWDSVLGPSPF